MIDEIRLESPQGGVFIPKQSVDCVGIDERAGFFRKRSIKKESKLRALYEIIKMIDLTTLEGADTVGRVRQMCYKAKHPLPPSLYRASFKTQTLPHVAAVCVYPVFIPIALEKLKGTDIQIASVAAGFPSGQLSFAEKMEDVRESVKAGATEIDMVMNRNAFLSGKYQMAFDEIVAIKEVCENVHLKVILETGELGSYDKIRLASHLAIQAGADFIKTSTGKISSAATLPVTLVMLQTVKDFFDRTGVRIGVKPAGGIKDAKMAIQYLCMVKEVLGSSWLTPKLFRFGASSLLSDVIRQIYKQTTGNYHYTKGFLYDS